MKYLNVFLFLAVTFGPSKSWSQTKKVKCANGDIVFVYKRPEKQYQQYVKTTNINLKASIDLLDKIKLTNIDAGTKRAVTELRDKLDNYSSRTQDIIKASFLAYNSTPCDTFIRHSHYSLLENINKENTALEKLKIESKQTLAAGNLGGIDSGKVKAIISAYNKNNGEVALKSKPI